VTRVVILTGDPIGTHLAGPAIRAWSMASALAAVAEVRLVSHAAHVDPPAAPFVVERLRAGDRAGFRELEAWADVIVCQGTSAAAHPELTRTEKVLVFDLYVPAHLEQLEFDAGLTLPVAERRLAQTTRMLDDVLLRGDFFLCASERQRMLWLGHLAALGRINPYTYRDDPALDRLIRVVPFGLASEPPVHDRLALQGVHPAIGPDDTVLIWGGGLRNWFDPLTLIRAVALLTGRRPDVRLFFMGTRNPNPEMPEEEIVAASRTLARELGVEGTHVIFNDDWVAFDDRQNYLLEADLGVSTHPQHIETTFSFRTRILDYLWAGLPMVVTRGDTFADLVAAEDLGETVPEHDVEALAAAIERIAYDDERHAEAAANVRRVAARYEWSAVLAPLVEFVSDPRRAADRPTRSSSIGEPRRPSRLERVRSVVEAEGVGGVARRLARKLRRG